MLFFAHTMLRKVIMRLQSTSDILKYYIFQGFLESLNANCVHIQISFNLKLEIMCFFFCFFL